MMMMMAMMMMKMIMVMMTPPLSALSTHTWPVLGGLQVWGLWCRVFNIYGENEGALRLHKYINNRLSNGKVATILSGHKIRDYMDVKDATKLIVSYALGSKYGVVNICSGVPISVMDIAKSIAKKYNRLDLLDFKNPPNIESDDDFIVGITD
jgi:dTDP-6-deoxy-L-talose 4-dehydrogenase (NAD+)